MKLSIIIPVYNEVKTLEEILKRIKNQTHIDKEIILIDDYSTDGSRELIEDKLKLQVDKILLNEKNFGKGYSVRQGIKAAEGDIILIQDADLEYSPSDYSKLINPILNNNADGGADENALEGANFVIEPINEYEKNSYYHISQHIH